MRSLQQAVAIILCATSSNAETFYARITSVQPNCETVSLILPELICFDGSGNVVDVEFPTETIVLPNSPIDQCVVPELEEFEAQNGESDLVNRADMHVPYDSTRHQCGEALVQRNVMQVLNYTVEYEWNNIRNTSITDIEYSVGDIVPIAVSIQIQ